jgi:cell division protein FtsL
MSRTAAATTAGRTIARPVGPAKPRRVSGPAGPPRRDPNAPAPRAGASVPAPAHVVARQQPARAPRARIDPTALAYADAALAPSPRARAVAAPRSRPLTSPRTRPRTAVRPQRLASSGVGLAYGGVAIASRMANVAIDVSASRLMDRVVRSRVWIGVIAVVLTGIVAMQVSLLKLNSGITRAVQTASTLEQSNSALRRDISRLSSGERIQPLAERMGLVMPAPADVGYLSARDGRATAARAAKRMTAPDPARAGLGGTVAGTQLGSGVATSTSATTPVAPAATAPAATATAPATGTTAPAAATTLPAAGTGAAQTTPPATQTAAPPVTTPPAVAATTAPPAGAGGAAAQATPQTP